MNDGIYFLLANLILSGFTAFVAFRRTSYQNVTDDSQASVNFRNIIVSLQAEVKEVRNENTEIREMLGKSHLEIALSIEMGKQPNIISWKWLRRETDISLTETVE